MRPDDRRYAVSHEWARPEGEPAEGTTVTIGISDFAVEQLTDLVYIDLPSVGDTIVRGEVFGEIESVKAVSELYAPISGEVLEVHEGLEDQLDRVAEDPFGDGWFMKIGMTTPADFDSLLTAADYEKAIDSETP
jgi:glycine cleavage system H protein